jgi:hypothetical protein
VKGLHAHSRGSHRCAVLCTGERLATVDRATSTVVPTAGEAVGSTCIQCSGPCGLLGLADRHRSVWYAGWKGTCPLDFYKYLDFYKTVVQDHYKTVVT